MHWVVNTVGVCQLVMRAMKNPACPSRWVCPVGARRNGRHVRASFSAKNSSVMRNKISRHCCGWFRGLDADLTQHPSKVEVHAKLLIRREPEEPKFEFSPLKFFTGAKAKAASD